MYNTIIIGAGPAGMAAALYLERSGLKTLIIDKDAPGGQLLKTDIIENYLGYENISGADLALKMFNQIKKINIDYSYGDVIKVTKKKNFIVTTDTDSYQSKNVIIATGKVNNKLNLKNEDIKGISYCAVCDGTFYKNKIVAVVGAGDTAFTEALYLSNIAKKVYIINRSENIKANNQLQVKTKNRENIIYLSSSKVTKIIGEDIIKGIILNNKTQLNIDGLFLALGGSPQIDFIEGIKQKDNYIIVNKKMQTNISRLYAIGDVIKKDHYQIHTAINDGLIAALTIKEGE